MDVVGEQLRLLPHHALQLPLRHLPANAKSHAPRAACEESRAIRAMCEEARALAACKDRDEAASWDRERDSKTSVCMHIRKEGTRARCGVNVGGSLSTKSVAKAEANLELVQQVPDRRLQSRSEAEQQDLTSPVHSRSRHMHNTLETLSSKPSRAIL